MAKSKFERELPHFNPGPIVNFEHSEIKNASKPIKFAKQVFECADPVTFDRMDKTPEEKANVLAIAIARLGRSSKG